MKKLIAFVSLLLMAGMGRNGVALATDLEVGTIIPGDGFVYATKSTNLISNGSFEDGFTGWTNSSDYSTEITSEKFTLKTDGAQDGNNYLVGTTNGGQNDVGSLGKVWEIESGKTYYFTYWIKGQSSSATNASYMKTSLTNTPGTESLVIEEASKNITTSWKQIEIPFTNTDGYKYLMINFRWLDSQWGFDDFQLYEIEEVDNDVDDDEFEIGDEVEDMTGTYTVASANLFVNGGFNDGMNGWTAGGYAEAAKEENFTIHANGGFNDGHYLVTASGGASNEKTPTQAIAVEVGATYLFVGYTNGNEPDHRYSALFEMNDDGTAEVSHTEGDTSYSNEVIRLNWGDGTNWERTEHVFTATTKYVGMRMGWSTGSYDGFQLYKVTEVTHKDINDDEYANGDIYADGTYKVVSDNMVVNGGFDDSTLNGWVSGSYNGTEAVIDYVHHIYGGYNDGAYITLNSGAAAATSTPRQLITVETGKTYLFIGYTSGTTVTDSNKAYNCLFKVKDDYSEDGYWTQLNWGTSAGVTSYTWTKTEYVFTADSHPYVGIRLGWSGADYDAFQLYELEAVTPEDASPENPVDLTSLIANPDAYDASSTGWTCSNNVNGMTRQHGEHWSGTDTSYFEPDDWSYTLWEEEMYQTITLPYDGVYRLTASGRSSDEARTTLFAGDVEHVFPALGATGGTIATDGTTCEVGTEGYTFANDGAGYGWTWGSVEVDCAGGSALTIGARFQSFTADTHQWASIVNFKLAYLGSADDTKIDAAREDLGEYIDYAETIDTETNVGTAAFQRPQTAVDALTSAITAARSALDASGATEASLLSALSALEEAVDDYENATLNTPAAGQTFAIVMSESDFTYDGKAVNFVYDTSNNTNDWRCFFDADWNRNYAPQHFTFTPDDSKTNGYIISTVAEGGTAYYLKLNTDNKGIRATTSKDDAFVFQVVATETEGIWHIHNSAAHMNVGSNGDHGLYTDNAHTNLQLASNEIPVNITAAGWTTLVLPYAASLPSSDLTAYTIAGQSTSQDNAVTLTEVTGTLQAGQPYLINGTTVKEYAINGTSTVFDLSTAPSDSYLVGTWEYIPSVTTGNYVLQNQPDVDGTAFYIVNSDDITLAMNRCYLLGTSVSTANAPYFSLSMNEDTTTAIEAVAEETAETGDGAIYDLGGRRVSKARKGIYIKDGKKVTIK